MNKKIISFFNYFNYKNWSIKSKLLSITSVLILLSVLFTSIFSYSEYTKEFAAQSEKGVQQIIDQLSLNIETYINEILRLSVTPVYNSSVMQALDSPKSESDAAQLEKRWTIENSLENMMITPRQDILSVYIIADEIYRGGKYSASFDYEQDLNQYDWYKKALQTDEYIIVPVHKEQLITNPKFRVFSVVKRLNSIKHRGTVLGVIKVDANYTGIESICSRVNMGKDGGLLILDENRNTIYSSAGSENLTDICRIPEDKGKSKSGVMAMIGTQKYMVNSTSIPHTDWTLFAVNSLKNLNEEADCTRNKTFLISVACSVLAILVLLLFTNSFIKPLMKIVNLMREVENGNFHVKFQNVRKDEIGYLGFSFNRMTSRLNETMEENANLVKEIYEAQYLQKEAQINALCSQIKPHFIYNTLNMISMLMQCGRCEKAVDNINKLSSLLRSMARIEREVSVREELQILDAYLGIQASRYDGRLEYAIQVDEDLYSYRIPSLIFQPIVENSVIHGCEKRKEKTSIRVMGRKTENLIQFVIEDNADGMEEEQLQKLREKISQKPSEPDSDGSPGQHRGIGLLNVNRRIKIKFGDSYGLKIDSKKGVGTRVVIELPGIGEGGIGANV